MGVEIKDMDTELFHATLTKIQSYRYGLILLSFIIVLLFIFLQSYNRHSRLFKFQLLSPVDFTSKSIVRSVVVCIIFVSATIDFVFYILLCSSSDSQVPFYLNGASTIFYWLLQSMILHLPILMAMSLSRKDRRIGFPVVLVYIGSWMSLTLYLGINLNLLQLAPKDSHNSGVTSKKMLQFDQVKQNIIGRYQVFVEGSLHKDYISLWYISLLVLQGIVWLSFCVNLLKTLIPTSPSTAKDVSVPQNSIPIIYTKGRLHRTRSSNAIKMSNFVLRLRNYIYLIPSPLWVSLAIGLSSCTIMMQMINFWVQAKVEPETATIKNLLHNRTFNEWYTMLTMGLINIAMPSSMLQYIGHKICINPPILGFVAANMLKEDNEVLLNIAGVHPDELKKAYKDQLNIASILNLLGVAPKDSKSKDGLDLTNVVNNEIVNYIPAAARDPIDKIGNRIGDLLAAAHISPESIGLPTFGKKPVVHVDKVLDSIGVSSQKIEGLVKEVKLDTIFASFKVDCFKLKPLLHNLFKNRKLSDHDLYYYATMGYFQQFTGFFTLEALTNVSHLRHIKGIPAEDVIRSIKVTTFPSVLLRSALAVLDMIFTFAANVSYALWISLVLHILFAFYILMRYAGNQHFANTGTTRVDAVSRHIRHRLTTKVLWSVLFFVSTQAVRLAMSFLWCSSWLLLFINLFYVVYNQMVIKTLPGRPRDVNKTKSHKIKIKHNLTDPLIDEPAAAPAEEGFEVYSLFQIISFWYQTIIVFFITALLVQFVVKKRYRNSSFIDLVHPIFYNILKYVTIFLGFCSAITINVIVIIIWIIRNFLFLPSLETPVVEYLDLSSYTYWSLINDDANTRNLIKRCFVKLLWLSTKTDGPSISRARIRWGLAYTLVNNRRLIPHRRNNLDFTRKPKEPIYESLSSETDASDYTLPDLTAQKSDQDPYDESTSVSRTKFPLKAMGYISATALCKSFELSQRIAGQESPVSRRYLVDDDSGSQIHENPVFTPAQNRDSGSIPGRESGGAARAADYVMPVSCAAGSQYPQNLARISSRPSGRLDSSSSGCSDRSNSGSSSRNSTESGYFSRRPKPAILSDHRDSTPRNAPPTHVSASIDSGETPNNGAAGGRPQGSRNVKSHRRPVAATDSSSATRRPRSMNVLSPNGPNHQSSNMASPNMAGSGDPGHQKDGDYVTPIESTRISSTDKTRISILPR